MAVGVLSGATVLIGTAWTGTAPGAPGTQTVSGTITSATDISSWVTAVDIPWEIAMEDASNMASGGFYVGLPGQKSSKVGLGLINDYAAASLDVILRSTIGFGTLFYVDIKPTISARGATNPSYVFATYLVDYKPIAVQVAKLSSMSVTWPATGAFGALTA